MHLIPFTTRIARYRYAAVGFSLLLGACQPHSEQSTDAAPTLTFSPPAAVLQTRAIDIANLQPIVRLSDGVQIPMQATSDNQWSGTIKVRPNQQYSVTVEWVENIDDRDLLLAQWSGSVDVDGEGGSVSIAESDYDINFDVDGDNITNLQERRDDTDPFAQNNHDTDANTDTDTENNSSDSSDNPTDGTTTDNGAGETDSNNDTGNDNGNDNGNGNGNGNEPEPNNDPAENEQPEEEALVVDTPAANESDNDTSTASDSTVGDTDNANTPPPEKAMVMIPRIDPQRAPVVNGQDVQLDAQGNLTGEWAGAAQFDDAGAKLWIKNLMIDNGADSQNGAELRSWAALHDGEYLYVLVLSDDTGARQSDSSDMWEDDTLELFIDGNNSKQSQYGEADDFQFLIPLLKLNSKKANDEITGRFVSGPFSSNAPLNLIFMTGAGIGPDGIRIKKWEQDVYELAIPIAQAGITVGAPFGFELQLNDDDDGDGRDSKWGWFHPAASANNALDLTYQNPSFMGTAILQN